jgi:DMSO/TMAO reductase YedYZ molybdopterin-dependent catalytic subunit
MAKLPKNIRDKRRLPPGQELTRKWPVLDLGDQPNLTTNDWALSVGGLVSNPIKWNWADFMAQPQTDSVSDIHCVTAWSRFDNHWQGVSAKHFLSAVQPKPEAAFLMIKGYDGYATNVPIKWFDDEDVVLAHSWEGAPISREHGGPVRLILPKLYFWKSAKWIRHITFMDQDGPGYWEARGYHMEGDPWKEDRTE